MNDWIYIEPYTLLFKTSSECLFYNTLDYSKIVVPIDKKNQKLLEELAKKKCVTTSDNLADDQTTSELIRLIQNSNNGDVIPIENTKCRPAVFNPIINNQRAFEKLDIYDWMNINSEVMNYLEEIYLYVNGFEEGNSCDAGLYRQIPSYIESQSILNEKLLASFFKNIGNKQINRINILGGDIALHPQFTEIIRIVDEKAHIVNFYFRYDVWKTQYKEFLKSKYHEITILCPVCLFSEKPFNPKGLFNIKYAEMTRYIFIIQNENEYKLFEDIIQKNDRIKKYRCLPFFNKKNMKFFENFIFNDMDDLEDIKLTKREVYVNQEINNTDFGRITILPEGDIFANVNFSPIGSISDRIHNILYSELKSGKSWLRIRDVKPCNNCVYQFLCPSPSNYEIALGKPNLCHIQL